MKTIVCTLIALFLLGALPAHAQDSARAEVRLAAYKVATVHDAAGVHERLAPLEELRPGDTVEYEATYSNRSAQTVKNVQLSVPVPAGGLEYVAAQKAPLASTASVDGKSFAPMPLTRIEKAADGKPVVKPVPLADYRVLRWSLGDLPAGASRSVRARMHMPALTTSVASVPTSASSNDSTSRRN